jgi:hypothetical protein
MKKLLLLFIIATTYLNVFSQNKTSDTLYNDTTIVFHKWSLIGDIETAIGNITMYNIGIIGGVDFAHNHLFYGGGLVVSHSYRKETSQLEADQCGINEWKYCIAMDLRYNVLPNRKFSPLFQIRISKILDERSSNIKSINAGICYQWPNNNHAISASIGVTNYQYEIINSIMDSKKMTSFNLGFKF